MRDRATYGLMALFFALLVGVIWVDYARIPTAAQRLAWPAWAAGWGRGGITPPQ